MTHSKTHGTTNFLNSVLWFTLVLYLVEVQSKMIKFQISHWTSDTDKSCKRLKLDTSADEKNT